MARNTADIIREKIEALEKEIRFFQQMANEYRWSSTTHSYINCVAKNKKEINELQRQLKLVQAGWGSITV